MNDEEPNAIEGSKDLEVTVCENGVVNVHRPESDRAHSVIVDDKEAIRCSCKGHKFYGHCVHQDEVSRRPLVLSSASCTTHERVATDGGTDEDNRFLPPEHPEHVPEDEVEEEDDGRQEPVRSEPANFGGGDESGMDDLGDPADTIEEEDEEQAGALLGTVTGWEPSGDQTHEDEEIDRTPL